MMEDARQARTWDVARPGFGLLRWLGSAVESLTARFGAWGPADEDDDSTCGCDPEVVAALEYIASIVPDDEKG